MFATLRVASGSLEGVQEARSLQNIFGPDADADADIVAWLTPLM
jgi:hypothetical protein